ncbi:MAG: hypothetical protein KAQ83_03870 [Nanoarchaeota archaeon]|nr:hypothetical protein [Nanoarchaeota archaeon]
MKSLFVRPCHDDVLGYLSYFSKILVRESEKRGIKTINKEKEQATNKIISNIIKKQKPSFIMFNGHGAPDLICGHNNEVLINKDNFKVLKNKLIYSLSCSSAKILGKKIADESTAFIGYDYEFALGMDTNCQTSVYRDKIVKLFLDPSNLLVSSILKGNTAELAVIKAKKDMKRNISKLKAGVLPYSKDYLPFLFNNYMALSVKGDKLKTI